MAVSIKANPDGLTGAIQVNGVDAFSFSTSGITSGLPASSVSTTDTQTLTNKTIAFSSNTLTDVASTNTSQTLTNKTIAFGSNTLTDVASTNTSQTLTNKTLSTGVSFESDALAKLQAIALSF